MKEEDINNWNKIISEIDGLKKDNYGRFFKNHIFKGYSVQEFQYHKSWDWLIPVIIKLSENDDSFSIYISSIMRKYNYNIGKVWEIIIEYIKINKY